MALRLTEAEAKKLGIGQPVDQPPPPKMESPPCACCHEEGKTSLIPGTKTIWQCGWCNCNYINFDDGPLILRSPRPLESPSIHARMAVMRSSSKRHQISSGLIYILWMAAGFLLGFMLGLKVTQ